MEALRRRLLKGAAAALAAGLIWPLRVLAAEVDSRFPAMEEIAIFAEKNPLPLICRFFIPEGTLPGVSLRLKLAETTRFRAVVKAGGKYYMAAREVKAVGEGCA